MTSSRTVLSPPTLQPLSLLLPRQPLNLSLLRCSNPSYLELTLSAHPPSSGAIALNTTIGCDSQSSPLSTDRSPELSTSLSNCLPEVPTLEGPMSIPTLMHYKTNSWFLHQTPSPYTVVPPVVEVEHMESSLILHCVSRTIFNPICKSYWLHLQLGQKIAQQPLLSLFGLRTVRPCLGYYYYYESPYNWPPDL